MSGAFGEPIDTCSFCLYASLTYVTSSARTGELRLNSPSPAWMTGSFCGSCSAQTWIRSRDAPGPAVPQPPVSTSDVTARSDTHIWNSLARRRIVRSTFPVPGAE
jgi:hypothetical protein